MKQLIVLLACLALAYGQLSSMAGVYSLGPSYSYQSGCYPAQLTITSSSFTLTYFANVATGVAGTYCGSSYSLLSTVSWSGSMNWYSTSNSPSGSSLTVTQWWNSTNLPSSVSWFGIGQSFTQTSITYGNWAGYLYVYLGFMGGSGNLIQVGGSAYLPAVATATNAAWSIINSTMTYMPPMNYTPAGNFSASTTWGYSLNNQQTGMYTWGVNSTCCSPTTVNISNTSVGYTMQLNYAAACGTGSATQNFPVTVEYSKSIQVAYASGTVLQHQYSISNDYPAQVNNTWVLGANTTTTGQAIGQQWLFQMNQFYTPTQYVNGQGVTVWQYSLGGFCAFVYNSATTMMVSAAGLALAVLMF